MRLARGPSGQRRASYRRPALLRIPGLYQPLIQHGLAYFAEAGGVGAIDVVDVAMLPAEAHALVVDGLHDFVQALVHLVIGPLEPHAVLRHFQSADRHAAGVGRLAGAEENLLAEEDFHRFGHRGHIGASPTQMQPLPTRAWASLPLISFCVAHGSAIWHGTPQGRLPSKYLHLNCLAYSWMRPRLMFLSS